MTPKLLVLDFDGVVCDGMDEFVESSWRTLADLGQPEIPEARRGELRARFAALRPIVESGWEMAVMLGVLAESPDTGDAALRDGATWAAARDAFLGARGLQQKRVAAAFDDARVRWIDADVTSWLAHHRFYPGIADWLTRLAAEERLVYVLSTKGKPFLDALLAGQGITLPSDRVIGKAEPRRDKWDVIRELAAANGVDARDLWFVEDRLPTLLEMQRHAPDLADARVFLAEWGYMFPERDPAAARAAGIPVLSLERVVGPFEEWPT